MTVLVTGGAGFIGSHLVEALCAKGEAVRVLDDFSSGKPDNLRAVAKDIEVINGSIVDPDVCHHACAGVERVWHQAAIASVPQSVADPLHSHAVNLTGTLNMLVAARDAGVARFVFASSSAIYGTNPDLPYHEELLPMPVSPYANQKLAGELYTRQFASLYALPTVSLRYFNIFGPRQDPTSQYAGVISAFLAALLDGRAPRLYGDGEQNRAFVYVADCVRANLLAGFSDNPAILGGYFNIAADTPITINQLLASAQQVLGTDFTPTHLPPRAGDVRYSVANTDKARTQLGFTPQWSLEDGMRETAAWYKDWSSQHIVSNAGSIKYR